MKLLTLARDLRRRKGRERQGLFVAEGVRSVEALLQSPLHVTGVLHVATLRNEPRGAALLSSLEAIGVPSFEVGDAELTSAADTETPQGVLAIARIPEYVLPDSPAALRRILVLDALQDPGNAGTIVRTAAALGVDFTIALPGTVDLWNAKVVRSAMGALFSHPTALLPWERVESYLDMHRIPLWAADASGEDVHGVAVPERLALAVSNEGAGLSAPVAQRAAQRVSIPMSANVESLNVAVATGILLFALTPPMTGR